MRTIHSMSRLFCAVHKLILFRFYNSSAQYPLGAVRMIKIDLNFSGELTLLCGKYKGPLQ